MEKYTLEHSDEVLSVHNKDRCRGDACAVHKKTDHAFRGYPQVWFDGSMWRRSPPGYLWPDPDSLLGEELSPLVLQERSELILNRAKCLTCDSVITSEFRHDYVTCSCGNLSVDGGLDYERRGFTEGCKWEELSEYKKELCWVYSEDALRDIVSLATDQEDNIEIMGYPI